MNSGAVDAETLLQRARQSLAGNRRDVTLGAVRRLAGQAPDLGPRWGEVAKLAADIGDMRTAIIAQRKLIAHAPDDLNHRFALARMLGGYGRTDEGMKIAEAVLAQVKGAPGAKFRVAFLASHLGMIERAAELFREVVEADPMNPDAWSHLQNLDRSGRQREDIAAMQAVRPKLENAAPTQRAALEFALGDAFHKLEERDDAFAHFDAGSKIMAAHDPYHAGAFDDYVDTIINTFDADFYDSRPGAGAPGKRPLFVLGMARSGTTLLQRLLSAHSAVADGGELSAMRIASYPLGRFQPERMEEFEKRFAGRENGPWSAVGDVYQQLIGEQFGPDGHIVDKAINLPFMAGVIRAGLPQAPVVWIRRDPCDVAWSNFRIRLLNQQNWSWRLQDIAHRMAHFEKLREHFAGLFPNAILKVEYEDLAREPDVWIPKILAHCGLEPEPVQDRFHKSDKAIATASLESARQPISTKSIGRWKAYEKHLQPFIDAYQTYSSDN